MVIDAGNGVVEFKVWGHVHYVYIYMNALGKDIKLSPHPTAGQTISLSPIPGQARISMNLYNRLRPEGKRIWHLKKKIW